MKKKGFVKSKSDEHGRIIPYFFSYVIFVFVNLVNLVTLNLGHNFIDGQIPDTIGSIPTLREVRLNDNLLQGGIPISFGNLSSLGKLSYSYCIRTKVLQSKTHHDSSV